MIFDRVQAEAFEKQHLSEWATKSADSKGRIYPGEIPDDFRTCFQRDRDRIIHSKAFRRLKHKTQVFLSPEGDHYRTRLTHTIEVSQIARSMARALRLNEDLTEAIALAHDLGHTPFGHCGEKALNDIHPGGFDHAKQSIRVVEFLERRPKKELRGLNLSIEVLDGIRNHGGKNVASTPEGQLIKYADRIAYVNHDTDDAIRAGILKEDVFRHLDFLGTTSSQRISTFINDLITTSDKLGEITLSKEKGEALDSMRHFLFSNLYFNPKAKSEEAKAEELLKRLYLYFLDHPKEMGKDFYEDYLLEGNVAVKDFVSGMTDRYAIQVFRELFVPETWSWH
ncbi:deoxyguanosinetriphosphate triphosphohydrolase [Guggenheimella bovis]